MSSIISNSKIKKYVRGLFWFLCFVFLFDRGLYLLIQNLESNYYTRTKFEETFARYVKDKNYSTLILGTSRTYEGIHPVHIEKHLGEKAFKETFQGKGPKYNYYFYEMYKKYAGVPDVVIYGVDYFIYSVKSDPKWMARFELDKEDVEEKIDLFSSPLLLLKNKKQIDTFFKNVLIGMGGSEDTGEEGNDEEFKEFDRIRDYIGIEAPNKKLATKPFPDFLRQRFIRPPGTEGKYFRLLLETWARDNVTVILVGLPDYFGTYKTNIERERFAFHLKTFRRDFKNVFIYNYNRPRNFELTNVAYFNDGGYGLSNSHLSQTGARVFNQILCEDIKKHYKAKSNSDRSHID